MEQSWADDPIIKEAFEKMSRGEWKNWKQLLMEGIKKRILGIEMKLSLFLIRF